MSTVGLLGTMMASIAAAGTAATSASTIHVPNNAGGRLHGARTPHHNSHNHHHHLHDDLQHHKHRQLQLFEKNDHMQMDVIKNLPQEINVDAKLTYNEKFMPMMTSSCRPEVDGYFGATSGEPIKVEYGFSIEVQPLSQVMDVLDLIEDRIVDSILINSFPDFCGARRRRRQRRNLKELQVHNGLRHEEESHDHQNNDRSLAHEDGHPSGFRFVKFEDAGTCRPKESEVNFCGVVTGTVYLYGRYQQGEDAALTVLSYVEKVLNTNDASTIHSELVGIEPIENFFKISGEIAGMSFEDNNPHSSSSGGDKDDGLSRVGILMVVITCLLMVAIGYYAYMRWNGRKQVDTMVGQGNRFEKQSNFTDYDPSESSIYPNDPDENEDQFEDVNYDDEYEYEEEVVVEEYEEEEVEEQQQEEDEEYDDFNSKSGFVLDQSSIGVDRFVDELDSIGRDSLRSERSRRSRSSRSSVASSRRREEFERLRAKTGLHPSPSDMTSTKSLDDREFSPYYDDDDDKASYAIRSSIV